jgi:exonuclease III
MSCICYNYHGLGSDATVRELHELVKLFKPNVLCVVETQLHKSRVEGLAKRLGYDHGFAVSSTGCSGGLGMFWNNEIKLDILPYSHYHIDAVSTERDNEPWRLTCVYGEAQTSERHKTWEMLRFIKCASPLSWMCIGDFNEVLHQHEHEGVADRSLAQMDGFREALDVCELADLGYEGNKWTFEERVARVSFCRVRLDRAVATTPWSSKFPGAVLIHLIGVTSDHCPIFLRWRETARERRVTEDKIFRYEMMWEKHNQFKPHLDDAWKAEGKAMSMHQLQAKLTRVSGSLDRWRSDIFGNVRKEIKELNDRLDS